MHTGVLSLIYTRTRLARWCRYDDAIRGVQCLATSRWYHSFREQGVIPHSTRRIMHFRDPKAYAAFTWWMVVGAKDPVNTRGRSCFIAAVRCVNGPSIAYRAYADAGESYTCECPTALAISII
ncbi:hypothetical protein [Escherichia coli]|uniref:hypothetical protein n=1 Tax=Escherichia coli TaxID=562 RepID=UPI0038556AD7